MSHNGFLSTPLNTPGSSIGPYFIVIDENFPPPQGQRIGQRRHFMTHTQFGWIVNHTQEFVLRSYVRWDYRREEGDYTRESYNAGPADPENKYSIVTGFITIAPPHVNTADMFQGTRLATTVLYQGSAQRFIMSMPYVRRHRIYFHADPEAQIRAAQERVAGRPPPAQGLAPGRAEEIFNMAMNRFVIASDTPDRNIDVY